MSVRVDENGAADAGSQLQTQLYVNQRPGQLDDAIRAEVTDLAEATFSWRSPLAADDYAEYWDKAFLKEVGLSHHAADLKAFWPTGGPHWDALATVNLAGSDRPGVLLGEGKSYPGELYGSGCQAKPNSLSRALIEKSLAKTQELLGVRTKTPDDWCGPALPERQPPRARLLAAFARRARLARAPPVHRRPPRADERRPVGGRAQGGRRRTRPHWPRGSGSRTRAAHGRTRDEMLT
jgi:hypothetical protein